MIRHMTNSNIAHSDTASTPDVVSQIYTAFRHPVPLLVGGLLGGLVPTGTYTIGHGELTDPVSLQGAMVLGGLGFSAITVYLWGRQAFGSRVKAACFVLLIELMMSFSHTAWLSAVALSFLIGINAVANGCNLVMAYLQYQETQRLRAQSDALIEAIAAPVPAPMPTLAVTPELPTAPVTLAAALPPIDAPALLPAPVAPAAPAAEPPTQDLAPVAQATKPRVRKPRVSKPRAPKASKATDSSQLN
jgi:hypothetical protein